MSHNPSLLTIDDTHGAAFGADRATEANTLTSAGRRVVVVGSGTRFVSGISYYTHKLACSLAEKHAVSVVLMRRIIPRRFYPGRERVDLKITDLAYPRQIEVYDGVDWFWLHTIIYGARRLWRHHPDVVIFQWWTGAVPHSYTVLALIARLRGARIVVEFHEVQDTGEAQLRAARVYASALGRLFIRMASGFVIHSEHDRRPVATRYRMAGRPIAVIPHGPFDQYRGSNVIRPAPATACNVFFFGTIRPYKGLEDLVRAFDSIPPGEIDRYWLTVVGETWEGWTLPAELIQASGYRDRITFVNRYVTDDEVSGYLAGADVVVLPYHRSSASGPLHVAMSMGLPVVVTNVGGLPEAAKGYAGAIFVPPKDPAAIGRALPQAPLRRRRFSDPRSWQASAARYERLFAVIDNEQSGAADQQAHAWPISEATQGSTAGSHPQTAAHAGASR